MEHQSSLLSNIGLSIVTAGGMALIARLLKQPLILGYILAGVILGKEMGFALITDGASIELISEIGLIFLLFIIGLEIKIKDLAKMGVSMLIIGVCQFYITLALAYFIFGFLPVPWIGEKFNILYLSVAISLSSTLIVVKLLQDKIELSTVSGQLTLGILVLQDIWAILFIGLQANLNNPEASKIGMSFLAISGLFFVSFLFSKFVLTRIFHAIANRPELVLVISIAWCFAICGVADLLSLSREMGALIAGVTIAAFPFGADVISKVIGVRDFFVTLFFVTLGLKVRSPSVEILLLSVVILIFLILFRIVTITFPSIVTKKGARNGLIASFNLSQVSEFSLVIVAIGISLQHVSSELSDLILTSTIFSAILSTYFIQYNHGLALKILSLFSKKYKKEIEELNIEEDKKHKHGDGRDIFVLGYFRIAMEFTEYAYDLSPSLTKRIVIVDYNPIHREKLEKMGYRWAYGDIASVESLVHSGLSEAKCIVCSISDTFLKGVTNEHLLENLKKINPKARIILCADDEATEKKLLKKGASKVIVPGRIAGELLFELILEEK
ncbi:MAG: cation:proton antiporter [Leptospiraceae bacterium]|nr:cation:proton antiporter [Leptospiraceae bacterium]MCK6380291.1 cation:proton antiporter [Leptospiraceae bacterium]NUM41104.1 cation:proton antiporter [Leptospiraceae bacterium]